MSMFTKFSSKKRGKYPGASRPGASRPGASRPGAEEDEIQIALALSLSEQQNTDAEYSAKFREEIALVEAIAESIKDEARAKSTTVACPTYRQDTAPPPVVPVCNNPRRSPSTLPAQSPNSFNDTLSPLGMASSDPTPQPKKKVGGILKRKSGFSPSAPPVPVEYHEFV